MHSTYINVARGSGTSECGQSTSAYVDPLPELFPFFRAPVLLKPHFFSFIYMGFNFRNKVNVYGYRGQWPIKKVPHSTSGITVPGVISAAGSCQGKALHSPGKTVKLSRESSSHDRGEYGRDLSFPRSITNTCSSALSRAKAVSWWRSWKEGLSTDKAGILRNDHQFQNCFNSQEYSLIIIIMTLTNILILYA